MRVFSFKKKKPTIGLTLSGGGMRGLAHIAVLKALEEYNLKPDIISGTSAGAIVGAFYSYGKTLEEMIEIVKNTTFFSRSYFKLSKNGIFSSKFILNLFNDHFPENDFNILKIPLHVATTEMTHGKIEYFSEGKLFEPLLASSSVPFVLPPVKMNGKIYVDGGVLDNLPTEPIVNKCNLLIGSHINSISYNELKNMSLMKEFDRILHLAIAKTVYSKAHHCNIFLDPPKMTKFSLFKKNSMDEMFTEVYEYTCSTLEKKGYKKNVL